MTTFRLIAIGLFLPFIMIILETNLLLSPRIQLQRYTILVYSELKIVILPYILNSTVD